MLGAAWGSCDAVLLSQSQAPCSGQRCGSWQAGTTAPLTSRGLTMAACCWPLAAAAALACSSGLANCSCPAAVVSSTRKLGTSLRLGQLQGGRKQELGARQERLMARAGRDRAGGRS
jgi:hypothetical protein